MSTNTSTFNSVYDIKLAQIAALNGSTGKNYDSVYQEELEMLRLLEQGGMGAQIDDNNVSTGKVWSSSKTQDYAAAVGFHYMYVQTLPATGQPRTIYFVPTGETPVQGQPNDVCNEYMYFGTPDSSFAYWEQIGTRRIDMSQYYTKAQVDAGLNAKQNALVSGTNIKTINNNSILGSGNIDIQGGGAGVVSLTQAQYDALATKDPSIIYNITDATPYVMEDYVSKLALDSSWGTLPTTYNPYNTTTPFTTGGNGYFVSWNDRGQIIGKGNYVYSRSCSINGTSNTIYGSSNVALPSIYAPTTAGTSGQVLQSNGSGAPQWVDFRSDATYYISEADCSTGTYSTAISNFYADCIANEHIGPMQLVNNTNHTEGGVTYVSHSYYYPSSTRLYEGNVELWFFTTETGATWRNLHILITNTTVTADETTGTFGN